MREQVKILTTIIFGIAISLCIILARLEARFTKEEGIFQFFAETLSFFPGMPGSYMRKAYYIATIKNCSWTCDIGFGTFFPHRSIIVGERVIIGAYCIVGCAEIGDDTLIASHVSITSGKNQHRDESGAFTHKHFFHSIVIGPRTWIGEGAIIMANVGSDSIVGAGSVVTRDAPDHITAIGNPAKFIPMVWGTPAITG